MKPQSLKKRSLFFLSVFLTTPALIFSQAINMTTNAAVPVSTTTCSATFFDNGGSAAGYTNTPGIYTQTFCPLTAASSIHLFISTIDLRQSGSGANDDFISIYLGTGTGGSLLYTSPADVFTTNLEFYSNAGQCLTFVFRQNGSNSSTSPGWSVSVNCELASPLTQVGGTVTSCSQTFVDPGGIAGMYGGSSGNNPLPIGYYSHNSVQTYTFMPSTVGTYVSLSFTQFKLDASDQIIIIDGSGTSSSILGQYSGTTLPPAFTASTSNGCLKVIFISNTATSAPGWIAQVQCSALPGSSIPICSSANCSGSCGFTICSSGAFPISSGNGVGVQEGITSTSMGCLGLNGEVNSTWYYFKTNVSGTLGFVIDPPAGLDYDFAVYGPGIGDIVCPLNTGIAPLRCSYANNVFSSTQGNVGLVDGAGDLSEGAFGNGFVEDLNVIAGQQYALLINNFSNGNPQAAPTITWSGTAMNGLICGFALAGEVISFDGYHYQGANVLHWKTASEHNTDYFTVKKSRDGQEWQTLTKIPAAGASNTILSYQLTDNESDGLNYYDLFLTDKDGKQNHVSTIYVNADLCSDGFISAYFPNPTNGKIRFQYCGTNFEDALEVKLHNAFGTLVFDTDIRDFKESSAIELDLSSLENGVYYATIYQNGEVQTKRISLVK
jgi:hypothetical protein